MEKLRNQKMEGYCFESYELFEDLDKQIDLELSNVLSIRKQLLLLEVKLLIQVLNKTMYNIYTLQLQLTENEKMTARKKRKRKKFSAN